MDWQGYVFRAEMFNSHSGEHSSCAGTGRGDAALTASLHPAVKGGVERVALGD